MLQRCYQHKRKGGSDWLYTNLLPAIIYSSTKILCSFSSGNYPYGPYKWSHYLLWDWSTACLASKDGGYWSNRRRARHMRSSYGRSWGMRERRWWTIAMSHSVCFTSCSLCNTIWGADGRVGGLNTRAWTVAAMTANTNECVSQGNVQQAGVRHVVRNTEKTSTHFCRWSENNKRGVVTISRFHLLCVLTVAAR